MHPYASPTVSGLAAKLLDSFCRVSWTAWSCTCGVAYHWGGVDSPTGWRMLMERQQRSQPCAYVGILHLTWRATGCSVVGWRLTNSHIPWLNIKHRPRKNKPGYSSLVSFRSTSMAFLFGQLDDLRSPRGHDSHNTTSSVPLESWAFKTTWEIISTSYTAGVTSGQWVITTVTDLLFFWWLIVTQMGLETGIPKNRSEGPHFVALPAICQQFDPGTYLKVLAGQSEPHLAPSNCCFDVEWCSCHFRSIQVYPAYVKACRNLGQQTWL